MDLAFNSIVFLIYVAQCMLNSAPVIQFEALLDLYWLVKQLKCFLNTIKKELLTRRVYSTKPYKNLSWKGTWRHTRYSWIIYNFSYLKILSYSTGLRCYQSAAC